MDFKDRLLKWYDEKGKNVDKYNPWEEGEIGGEKINGFVDALKDDSLDFCWVDDKKAATKYIVPYVLQGDYKNANFYQCLYNPGVSENIWNINTSNFQEFKKEIESKEAAYIQEMYKATKFKEVQNIIISPNNMLYLELQEINKNRSEFKNSQKKLKEFINKNCYYIKTYYKGVLTDSPNSTLIDGCVQKLMELLENREKFKSYLKQVEKYKICNLELVPFPTRNTKDIKSSKVDREYTDFVAAIILSRIAKFYSEKEVGELTFVFRSKKAWQSILKRFLKTEKIIQEKSFNIEESFLEEHFFYFSGRNACISSKGIKNIDINDFKKRISDFFQYKNK